MISIQLAFRVPFLKVSKLLAYVVLQNGASWASGLLFRAHVVPACKPVFFNYNFHEEKKKVSIKTRPISASHSIEG